MSLAPDDFDGRLAAARPEPPAGLADAIMRRVTAEARRRRLRRTGVLVATAAACAAAAVVLLPLRPTSAPATWRVTASDGVALSTGAALAEGDDIEVPGGGRVRLALADDRAVRLDGVAAARIHRDELVLVRGRALLEGRAVITTPRARVIGMTADTLAELVLDTQPDEETSMLTPKTALLLAATAGSVLTVTVIRGRADVRATGDDPSIMLAAGERVVLPGAETPQPVPTTATARLAAEPRPSAARDVIRPPVAPPSPPTPAPDPSCEPSECDGAECDPTEECEECEECDMVVEDDPTARVVVHDDGPSLGSAQAKVVVVVFTAYGCSFCEKALSPIHQLADLYPNDVRVVLKNFPLTGPGSDERLAAEAALAAGQQGKFWAMHDVLLANQDDLDRASIESYARSLELDMKAFRAALDDHRHAAQVQRDADEGLRLGVRGVPTFYINGRVVTGVRPIEDLKQIVDEELAQR